MLEFLSKLPPSLMSAALAVAAVAFLLRTLAEVAPKLRGGNGKSERVNSDPAPGNGIHPATPAQGFLVLGERIEGLRVHIDARFDELGGRLVAVEKTTAENSTTIAFLEGRDEARHDLAGQTGPHRRT